MRDIVFADKMHASTREWAAWGAHNLLEAGTPLPTDSDMIVFVHATDWLDRDRGLSRREQDSVASCCRLDNSVVVVVSGGVTTSGQRKFLADKLKPPESSQLHCYNETLPVVASVKLLEERFGEFARNSTASDPQFGLLYEANIDLWVAFRYLVQIYIISTSQRSLPQSLQQIKAGPFPNVLTRSHWAPVLGSDDKLREAILDVRNAERDGALYSLADSLATETDWKQLPWNIFSDYEDQWFRRLSEKDKKKNVGS